jgi:hypothetical protein
MNKNKQMTTQVPLALNATWSVLRDPVLTKMYVHKWKRYISKCSKTSLLAKNSYLSMAMCGM